MSPADHRVPVGGKHGIVQEFSRVANLDLPRGTRPILVSSRKPTPTLSNRCGHPWALLPEVWKVRAVKAEAHLYRLGPLKTLNS